MIYLLEQVLFEDALKAKDHENVLVIISDPNTNRPIIFSLDQIEKGIYLTEKVKTEIRTDTKPDTKSSPSKDSLIDRIKHNESDIPSTELDKQQDSSKLLKDIPEARMTNSGDVVVSEEDTTKQSARGRKIQVDLGKMRSLKNAGWSKKDIAEDLKCSMNTVYKYWSKI